MKGILKNSLLSSLLLLGVPVAQAEANPEKDSSDARARMESPERRGDNAEVIRKASDVYRSFSKNGEVPTNVLKKAQCVVVIPEVVTAAAVIGGTHGDGIASCKEKGVWSAPAFVDLTGGSLGAQIGGKSSDIVLFLMDDQAKQALKRGRFTLGADVSVVAGEFERSFETEPKGIVAYTRTSGAFAGASIIGVNLEKDDEAIREYYGKPLSYQALLEGSESVDRSRTESFTNLLPS